jgi:hypothetical protein
MSATACPPVDQLEELAYGRLADSDIDSVLQHVAACTDCRLGCRFSNRTFPR